MDTPAPARRPGVLRRVGRLIRRILVTIAGTLVTVVGVVLLPLPGPGWLIIFGGLSILATEYTWAARLLHSVRNLAVRWENWAKRQPLAVRLGMVFLGILIVAAVAYAVYWYYFVR
jgi:uncharacterized protein (TIGR02611 family)